MPKQKATKTKRPAVAPVVAKPRPAENVLVRMARLFTANYTDRARWLEIAFVSSFRGSLLRDKIRPIPAWLAANATWKECEEEARAKAEGIYCETENTPCCDWQCDVCGKERGPRDPRHIADNDDGYKYCCPDCCPACRKRNGPPVHGRSSHRQSRAIR
jgi:hypothetical protein